MIHECALDFIGGDAVTGDIHDVIHPPQQPEVAVLIDFRAIARKILARISRPILFDVTVRIAINRAEHRRPRFGEHEVAPSPRTYLLALVIQYLGFYPRKRNRGRPRLSGP